MAARESSSPPPRTSGPFSKERKKEREGEREWERERETPPPPLGNDRRRTFKSPRSARSSIKWNFYNDLDVILNWPFAGRGEFFFLFFFFLCLTRIASLFPFLPPLPLFRARSFFFFFFFFLFFDSHILFCNILQYSWASSVSANILLTYFFSFFSFFFLPRDL